VPVTGTHREKRRGHARAIAGDFNKDGEKEGEDKRPCSRDRSIESLLGASLWNNFALLSAFNKNDSRECRVAVHCSALGYVQILPSAVHRFALLLLFVFPFLLFYRV